MQRLNGFKGMNTTVEFRMPTATPSLNANHVSLSPLFLSYGPTVKTVIDFLFHSTGSPKVPFDSYFQTEG